MPTPYALLSDLLESMFSSDELRKFLRRLTDGQLLVNSLPSGDRSTNLLSGDAVDMLQRRARVDEELFCALVHHAPPRSKEIVLVAQAWGIDLQLPREGRNQAPVVGGGEAVFRWLHWSDLHHGCRGADRWPGLEREIRRDLRNLHHSVGPWDAVLFTGDLVQRGEPDLFVGLDKVLSELAAFHTGQLGFNPVLITVPGNHDLVWVDDQSPIVKKILDYDQIEDIDKVWEDVRRDARRLITDAFAPYQNWQCNHGFGTTSPIGQGILPGDQAINLRKNGLTVGILSLNSAFLQLVDKQHVPHPKHPAEPFQERLVLHVSQFHAACGGNGPRWAEEDVDVAFLLTHHPPSWLHPRALAHFREEIYTPGRFVAHLFGHMHEHIQSSIEEGGAEARRFCQGMSLFGIEKKFGEVDRRHGYTLGELVVKGNTATMRLWPRVAVKQQAGHWEIRADPTARLEADEGMVGVTVRIHPRRGGGR